MRINRKEYVKQSANIKKLKKATEMIRKELKKDEKCI